MAENHTQVKENLTQTSESLSYYPLAGQRIDGIQARDIQRRRIQASRATPHNLPYSSRHVSRGQPGGGNFPGRLLCRSSVIPQARNSP